jgi:hypothetical protein
MQRKWNKQGKLASIALMMEAVNTFETSINFYKTEQRNIPEHCHFQRRIILCSNVKGNVVSA